MRALTFVTVATLSLAGPLCLGALAQWQFQTSAICVPQNAWLSNSAHDSPCFLAAVVVGSCEGHSESGPTFPSLNSHSGTLDYTLDAINVGYYYQEPNTTDANLCRW